MYKGYTLREINHKYDKQNSGNDLLGMSPEILTFKITGLGSRGQERSSNAILCLN